MTVEVEPTVTFRSIAKDFFLLRKKANSYSEHIEIDDCSPRMLASEIFFQWDQPVSEMLRLSWVFREKEPDQESLEDLIEHIIIVPKKDIGDAARRLSLRADPDEQAMYTGYLWKKGSGAIAAFRKRWFIIQGCTLYYQEDPSSVTALGFVPMGGCDVKLRTDLTHKTYGKTMFELTAESLGKRDFVLCAETQDEMNRFIAAVDALNLRRVKSVAVNVFEDLARRGYARMQGIFRVSGDKHTVDAIKRAYDMATYPTLSDYKDEHAIGSVVKLALRQMSSPLMPYVLYGDFVQMGRSNPSKRAVMARELVYQIPAAARHFLQYLCKSLNDVAVHQDTNMMSAKNLAIVFAPNIIRPQVETVQTSMSDNAAILACVNTLIEEQTFIFGPSPIRSNSVVPIFPPHLLDGASSFKVGSKRKTQNITSPASASASASSSAGAIQNQQTTSSSVPLGVTVDPPSIPSIPSPMNGSDFQNQKNITSNQYGQYGTISPATSPTNGQHSPPPNSLSMVSPFSIEGQETLSKVGALTQEARDNLQNLIHLQKSQALIIEQFQRLEKALCLGPFQSDGLVEFINDKTAVDFTFVHTLIDQMNMAASNLTIISEQLELNSQSTSTFQQQQPPQHHHQHQQYNISEATTEESIHKATYSHGKVMPPPLPPISQGNFENNDDDEDGDHINMSAIPPPHPMY